MKKTTVALRDLTREYEEVLTVILKYDNRIQDLIEEGVYDTKKSYTPDELVEREWFTEEEVIEYAQTIEKAISLVFRIETKSPFASAKLIYDANKNNLWLKMGAPGKSMREWYLNYERAYGERPLDRSVEWLATLNRVYEKFYIEILGAHPSLQEYVENTNISILDAIRWAVYPDNALSWLPNLSKIDKQVAPLVRERAFTIADKENIKIKDVTYEMVAESLEQQPLTPKTGDLIKVSRLPVQLRGGATSEQYIKLLSTEVIDDITFRQTYEIRDSPEEEGEVFTKDED